jgi:tetratricopeptide (TPR) repeat protein
MSRFCAVLFGLCIVAQMIAFPLLRKIPTTKAKKHNKMEVKVKDSVHQISYVDSVRFKYFFLEAERQQNADHYAAAFDLLEHCKAINPYASEVWFMQSVYFSELKNDSLALQSLQRAVQLNPDNTGYQERLAQMYISARDFTNAKQVYETLVEKNHDRTDILNILIQLYQQDKEYDKMLWAIERIETIEGVSEELTLSKMHIYERKDDKKSAWKALKSLSDEHPSDLNYKVMMGNWLMQNNKPKDAYKIFSKALKEEPDNSFVQSSLYDYYREVGDSANAHDMMDKILTSRKTDSSVKATMLRQFIMENEDNGGDSVKVLAVFDRVMKENPQDADMAELKAAYMSLKKFPMDSVNQALRDVLTIAPDNAGARLQILQNLWPDKKWDEIIDLCKPAVQYNPDEMAFYYFMGLAYYQKEDKESALDAFRRGVGEITPQSNKEIVSDFYALMGDILHQKGLEEEAFAAYDSCLQWKDDNMGALNNYAYYLSLNDKDLHKAEQMSYKTVKAEPTNSTYLDTYAWILFMQERYEESKIYIDQAVANDSDSLQSAVILDHAGDIYEKLGDITKALEYWQKALDADAGEDAESISDKILKFKKEE